MGLCAIAAFALAIPARAGIITNGSFENMGTMTSSFSISQDGTLPGWFALPSGNKILDCLVAGGATTNMCGTNAFGGGLTFWSFPGPSPDGGNYVVVDGDSTYSSPLMQFMTGLTVGQQYTVSFYQAAAQQYGYTGATTEQWRVSFGSASQNSTLMNTPSHGSVGWMSQSMTFTATAPNTLLTFLAVGTPSGEPPFVFLDGVSVNPVTPVPEPRSFALIGLGLIALPLAARWRKKRS